MDAKSNGILTYCKAVTNDKCYAVREKNTKATEKKTTEKGRNIY